MVLALAKSPETNLPASPIILRACKSKAPSKTSGSGRWEPTCYYKFGELRKQREFTTDINLEGEETVQEEISELEAYP